MTDEQINAAIAEVCGWKPHDHPDCMAKKVGWTMPEKWIMRPDGELVFRHDILNYCADLNAMHEAETVLNIADTHEYINLLYDIACKNQEENGKWLPYSISARQRAEAFLRTLGKWEEVQND